MPTFAQSASLHRFRAQSRRWLSRAVAAVLGGALFLGIGSALSPIAVAQALSPAERSQALLTTAKGAFNDGNYAVAADRFRDYLRLGAGGRNETAAARYGLGVSLIEGSRDYKNAAEALTYPAGIAAFKDRAFAAYYLGVAYRGLGEQARQEATTRPAATPADPAIKRQPARPTEESMFRLAAGSFAQAADLLSEKSAADKITAAADAKELPTELEWIARARCDQAEMLIRIGRYKEAWAGIDQAAHDAKFENSRYRQQAQYYLGYAAFGLKDYSVAVRTLAALAPFEQEGFGVHARYLLARVHHLAAERPEAIADYQGLITEWDRQRQDARARIGDPQTPAAEKEKLLNTASGPAPEYVTRALFYWGVALAEFGQADEALPRFLKSVDLSGESALADEARLRAGIAGVQVRKYDLAIRALSPILEDVRFGDQALRWLAKAQYGLGTVPVPLGKGTAALANAVADPIALAEGIKKAAATLKRADDKARAMSATDPAANTRRALILLELGDMLQLDHRYADAATVYAAIRQVPLPSGLASETAEQGMMRQAIALQLAGNYAEADKACLAFTSAFPRSALRPEALVRYAENALLATFASKDPDATAGKRPYSEAIARFTRVIERHPDSPQAAIARFGLATILYVQGQYGPAGEMLAKVPESDRMDDLVGVNLLLADCQLRALPESAEDALSGARMASQLEQILVMLDGFVATRPRDPDSADAQIRIGYAANKLAGMLADPAEKRRTMGRARRAYHTVVTQFPDHPLYPVALLENAKLLASYGSTNPAILDLTKFQTDPLNKTSIAPLALIHLADATRTRRKPDEAVTLLREIRAKYEADLLKDPNRAAWAPVLQHSLALSLKESGKYTEARELFQKIAADWPKRPEAIDATWRIAQCDMDPAMADVELRRRALANATKPELQAEALAALVDSAKALRSAAQRLEKDATALAARETESDVPQKMSYDAAWCWRIVGEIEVEAARRQIQTEALRKIVAKMQAEEPTAPISNLRPPEVTNSQIPLQPAEKFARERYRAVIDGNVSDSSLVDDSRVELGDLLASRDEYDSAITMLGEAISKSSNVDLADRLRVRMASLQLSKGDSKGAFATVNEIMTAGRTVYAGYAHLIAVEAAYQLKDFPAAIEHAKLFIDLRPYGRLVGTADHALLRMAQAQQQLGEWKPSQETLEMWITRFNGNSPLLQEAKFASAAALEQLKEYDKAAALFLEVAGRTSGELGAKANMRAGLMRLEQKQYNEALVPLLTVAYAYDDPDLNPPAMVSAAKALTALGKPAEARRLLGRVIKDFPRGQWAIEARKQLEVIK